MKKMLLVIGLMLLVSALPTFAQIHSDYNNLTYLVDYYANNAGPVPAAADQVVRLINVGLKGTPMTSPYGDVCSNICVFDNNQEMIACCSCRITPNGLATASVGTQLTNNPVTSVVPVAGVIKIITKKAYDHCDPTYGADALDSFDLTPAGDWVVGFRTHLQDTGGATFVTETNIPAASLGRDEREFLPLACAFARYLGSGKGTCSCTEAGL
jgi:hypothetical protein